MTWEVTELECPDRVTLISEFAFDLASQVDWEFFRSGSTDNVRQGRDEVNRALIAALACPEWVIRQIFIKYFLWDRGYTFDISEGIKRITVPCSRF